MDIGEGDIVIGPRSVNISLSEENFVRISMDAGAYMNAQTCFGVLNSEI